MLVMCRATERASKVPTVVEASRGVNTMWLRGEMTCAHEGCRGVGVRARQQRSESDQGDRCWSKPLHALHATAVDSGAVGHSTVAKYTVRALPAVMYVMLEQKLQGPDTCFLRLLSRKCQRH